MWFNLDLDVDKWAAKVIQDALVHSSKGGSFNDYIVKAMNVVLRQIGDKVTKLSLEKYNSSIDELKKQTYDKGFTDGRKSMNSSIYDEAYKDGYVAGQENERSMR